MAGLLQPSLFWYQSKPSTKYTVLSDMQRAVGQFTLVPADDDDDDDANTSIKCRRFFVLFFHRMPGGLKRGRIAHWICFRAGPLLSSLEVAPILLKLSE